MRFTQKHIRIISIIISLSSLILLVLLLASMLQKVQAPDDSQASGFGENATRDLFVPTAELFQNTPCENIFYREHPALAEFNEMSQQSFSISTENLEPNTDIPLSCKYNLGNDRAISFTVYSYSPNSIIDDTQKDLWNRINDENMDSIKDVGMIGIMDYFYGADKFDTKKCRSNVFHPINDFEFAEIVYTGFNCEEIKDLNREFVTVFGNYLHDALEFIYLTYAETTTEDLLYVWGFEDRIPNLEFYK